MKSQLVYICGPMKGYPRWNFDAFYAAEKRLKEMGYRVVNPAAMDVELDSFDPDKTEHKPLAHYMKRELASVCSCDIIAVLPGWEKSQGARMEMWTARELEKRIVYEQGMVDISPETLDEHLPKRVNMGSPIATKKTAEVRVTDPKTGGQKCMKVAAYDLLPFDALEEVAKVYGWGATKYADRNWEKGYKWGLSYAAMMRHAAAFWRREDIDPESGLRHLAHAVWHGLVMLTFTMRKIGTDSRGVECVPDPIPEQVMRDLENAAAKIERERAGEEWRKRE